MGLTQRNKKQELRDVPSGAYLSPKRLHRGILSAASLRMPYVWTCSGAESKGVGPSVRYVGSEVRLCQIVLETACGLLLCRFDTLARSVCVALGSEVRLCQICQDRP